MMQVTEYFQKCALRALEQLPEGAVSGVPIPEMDGYFIIRKGKGRIPEHAEVVATIRPEESEEEYEIYALSNGGAK